MHIIGHYCYKYQDQQDVEEGGKFKKAKHPAHILWFQKALSRKRVLPVTQ